MKKQYYLVMLIALLFLFSGSVHYQDDESSNLKKIIKLLNEQFLDAMMNNDLERYLSFYTEDAIVMLPFKPVLYGRDALRKDWINDDRGSITPLSASAKTLEIWESEGMIYERGQFAFSAKTKKSDKPYAVYGSYFSVWEKQDYGSYKMKYDISNLDHKL